jgi:SprT protein
VTEIPLSDDEQQEIVALGNEYIALAEGAYETSLKPVPVHFNLKGYTAGVFTSDGRKHSIRYNPWLFAKYPQENRDTTVPHEVAHYVVHMLYGARIKPHGDEWHEVMELFDADPQVTCDFDFSDIPVRKQRTVMYFCGCQLHEMSMTSHNRVKRRRTYYDCMDCGQRLREVGNSKNSPARALQLPLL